MKSDTLLISFFVAAESAILTETLDKMIVSYEVHWKQMKWEVTASSSGFLHCGISYARRNVCYIWGEGAKIKIGNIRS